MKILKKIISFVILSASALVANAQSSPLLLSNAITLSTGNAQFNLPAGSVDHARLINSINCMLLPSKIKEITLMAMITGQSKITSTPVKNTTTENITDYQFTVPTGTENAAITAEFAVTTIYGGTLTETTTINYNQQSGWTVPKIVVSNYHPANADIGGCQARP